MTGKSLVVGVEKTMYLVFFLNLILIYSYGEMVVKNQRQSVGESGVGQIKYSQQSGH